MLLHRTSVSDGLFQSRVMDLHPVLRVHPMPLDGQVKISMNMRDFLCGSPSSPTRLMIAS